MPTRGSPYPRSSARKSPGEPLEAMRIRLLGDFEVSVGPRIVGDASWRLRKAANLVKLLALAEGHRLHREQAMDLLWPDLAKRDASNNLRGLEENAAQTTPQRYHAFNLLGLLAVNEDGDPAQASALWKESLALARKTGDALRIAVSLCCLGYAAVLQGDNGRATALCEGALAYADEHEVASEQIVAETLINLGLAALGQGDYGRAISSFEKALSISQASGAKSSLINALEGAASLAGARGYAAEAARLWGAAEAGRETTGIALPPGDRTLHEPYLSSSRSRLGEEAWEEALSEGYALSLDEAATYALDKGVDRAATPEGKPSAYEEPVGKLSRREREVVALVGKGLTTRQISVELSISERTAGNHVAKILRKLGLRTRTQIVTWATEYGPLGPKQA